MKWLLGFLVAVLFLSDIDRIALINTLKSEGKKAYQSGDYKTAIQKYQYLVDSLQVKEDEVVMNLANALFHERDTANATQRYQSLIESKSPKIKSLSSLQLGVLADQAKKYEEALSHFKQALRADPTNEEARYNYELVKKKLEEQKKQEEKNKDQEKKDDQQKDKDQDKKDQEKKDQEKKDQEKKDQEKKDQQDQENKEKEEQDKKDKDKNEQQKEQEEQDQKDKKDIPPSVSEKLKEMEMSEEKAKMILEAMKNQEIQYLQQNKRKATKPKDKGKPDW